MWNTQSVNEKKLNDFCDPKLPLLRRQQLQLETTTTDFGQNVLFSFAVLMAGASISKLLLVFRHMGLSGINIRTYFVHQNKCEFPEILHHWETYRAALIQQLQKVKNTVWSGDERL